MPILGINYEKCNDCQICLTSCSKFMQSFFRRDKEQNKIVFDDPQNLCDSCGRCISRCKVDAIMYEDFDEILTIKGDQEMLITYDTLHNFMSSKRSIRGYKNKKIPREIMKKVLNTMKYAPTGSNVRTLQCTIISDDDKIKKLSEAVMDDLIVTNSTYGKGLKKARELGVDRIFHKAPHVMIIHSNNYGDKLNATIALTYGMFSAQSLGLASCWIGLARGVLEKSKQIREDIIGIDGVVWGVIILGYPNKSQKYYRLPSRPDIKTKGLMELS